MGCPTLSVQLREGQADPPGLDRLQKVRRFPTKDWPLIVVFERSQFRLRDETACSWAGLGYEVQSGETLDLDLKRNPGEY